MSSIEIAALIAAALVVAYNLRNTRWWRAPRPRGPFV
jgi:hypothetical protein